MSMNTTAIISATYIGQSLEPFITEHSFPKHLRDGGQLHQRFSKVPCEEHAGGANAWSDTCSGVWVAEFDYINVTDVTVWFLNLPWGSSDNATLMVEHESGDLGVVVIIGGKRVATAYRPVDARGPDKVVVESDL